MKCLIFPNNAGAPSGRGPPGGAGACGTNSSNPDQQRQQQPQSHSVGSSVGSQSMHPGSELQALISSTSQCQGGEEIMWEAPQLAKTHYRSSQQQPQAVAAAAAYYQQTHHQHHQRNSSLGEVFGEHPVGVADHPSAPAPISNNIFMPSNPHLVSVGPTHQQQPPLPSQSAAAAAPVNYSDMECNPVSYLSKL